MTDLPLQLCLLFFLLLLIYATAHCPTPCTCGTATDSNKELSGSTNDTKGTSVDCSGTGLTTVPLGIPEDTTALLLGANDLTDLFGQLPGPFPQLAALDLSRNRIKQLGRGTVFKDLTRLRELNLSRNDFRTVFNGVFRGTPRLEVLDMRHGQVRFVEERVFEGLGQLKRLLLAHNQLNAVFPEWFAGLESLEELRLEDNRISYINGGAFCGLTGLRILSLAGNRIRGVSEKAFDGLSNLTSLNLEDNQLSRVPSIAFRAAKSMKVLRLGGNSFPQLHTGDFIRLELLEEASVENIAELELIDRGAFQDMPNLKALHLHRNSRLQFVDSQAFINVPNLRILSLHGGNLIALSGETVKGFAKSLQISLHGNPLACDCNVKWLHEIVARTNNSSPKVSIQEPNSLSCRPLDDTLVNSLPAQTPGPHSKNHPVMPVNSLTTSTHSKIHDGPLVVPLNRLTSVSHSKKRYDHLVMNSFESQTTVAHTKEAQSSGLLSKQVLAVPLSSLAPSQIPANCSPSLVGEPNATLHKKVGDSHVFQCRAHGLPVPSIHWILPNGTVLDQTSNDVRVRTGPGSLALPHIRPRDAGPYSCVATNSLGTAASVTHLHVDSIDIHIFPLGVASTFVTVVWNGTARNSFPEYEIVYGRDDLLDDTQQSDNGKRKGKYQSVTVSQFFRSYTVNNLRPRTSYQFCIGVKSREDRIGESGKIGDSTSGKTGSTSSKVGLKEEYVQFSCTSVRTLDEEFALQGVVRTSNVAVAVAMGVVAAMGLVVCGAVLAARKYRQRHYDAPQGKTLVPMENLHSPLMAHTGS